MSVLSCAASTNPFYIYLMITNGACRAEQGQNWWVWYALVNTTSPPLFRVELEGAAYINIECHDGL